MPDPITAPPSVRKAPTPVKAVPYRISLSALGQSFTSEGATIIEALEKLEKPAKLAAKATLKVEHGSLKKELFLPPRMLKRLFYPICRPVTAKMLGASLK